MSVDLDIVLRLIERLGLPLALVIAFIQGWIIPRFVYLQLLNSEREFRQITLRNTELTDRAVGTAERVVEKNRPRD